MYREQARLAEERVEEQARLAEARMEEQTRLAEARMEEKARLAEARMNQLLSQMSQQHMPSSSSSAHTSSYSQSYSSPSYQPQQNFGGGFPQWSQFQQQHPHHQYPQEYTHQQMPLGQQQPYPQYTSPPQRPFNSNDIDLNLNTIESIATYLTSDDYYHPGFPHQRPPQPPPQQ